jgi:F0F1-type ATP synthase assembly protein I
MTAAMEWVGRITALALEMVLPGLAGTWLDDRWGTRPALTIIGFLVGMVGGIAHLLWMTAAANNKTQKRRRDKEQ